MLILFLACTPDDGGGVVRSHPGQGQRRDSDIGADSNGEADSDADADADSDADADTDPPDDGEMRGVWVDRWTYSNEADVRSIMNGAADAGFNAIFFQIRGNGDAYYQSNFEPWAKALSGTLGKNPGWDPLAVAVEAGHARGMQVHAYVNAFPLWVGTTPPTESTPRHAYLAHPDWVVVDTGGNAQALNASYVWMSPGNPDVRQRLVDVSADIADHYEVDGIHLDLVRYPGAQYSHDAASEASYDGVDWGDWQREQVVKAVVAVHNAVDVPVTAAVWGIYEDKWSWGSSEGNADYYQDSYSMLEERGTDANMPMIYWEVASRQGEYTDFTTLVKEFVANAHGRHIYAGLNSELGEDAVLACLDSARANGAQGVVVFDYGVMRDEGWLADFGARAFPEPKDPPTMPWR